MLGKEDASNKVQCWGISPIVSVSPQHLACHHHPRMLWLGQDYGGKSRFVMKNGITIVWSVRVGMSSAKRSRVSVVCHMKWETVTSNSSPSQG